MIPAQLNFYSWVQGRMEMIGLTQVGLGEALGMDQSQVSRILNQKQNMTIIQAVELSHILYVSVDQLAIAYVFYADGIKS